jgi:hypothetical protein
MRNTGIRSIVMIFGVLALSACSRESADWKSATTADTTEAYQQFLQQHPNSSNSAAAHARLKTLTEDRDWQVAAAADTRSAYEQFISQHADSKWVQEARIRIENFAQTGNAAPTSAGAAVPGSSPAAREQGAAEQGHHAAKAAPAKTQASTKVATAATGNFVQLGAFSTKERAQSEWKQLSARFPTELKSLKPDYVAGPSKHGTVYRLRVAVSSASAAKGLCSALKKHSQLCVPVTA